MIAAARVAHQQISGSRGPQPSGAPILPARRRCGEPSGERDRSRRPASRSPSVSLSRSTPSNDKRQRDRDDPGRLGFLDERWDRCEDGTGGQDIVGAVLLLHDPPRLRHCSFADARSADGQGASSVVGVGGSTSPLSTPASMSTRAIKRRGDRGGSQMRWMALRDPYGRSPRQPSSLAGRFADGSRLRSPVEERTPGWTPSAAAMPCSLLAATPVLALLVLL